MKSETENDLGKSVVRAIRTALGLDSAVLHEPSFNGNELHYLKQCIDSTFVSSVGKYVDQFESKLAEFTGSKYVVAVVNGTSALHIALKLAGVQQEDEVLLPALTFVATANAVAYCAAVPHFVDSEVKTLGIDAYKLRDYLHSITEQRDGYCINRRSGRVIRAVVPMHAFGHASDIDALLSIANDFNIKLIEDAAESLGTYYKGRHTGTFGLLGTLSFNGNKTITTGGGGAVLTNNLDIARQAKHLTTTAKIPHQWEYRHDAVGYNYRMPNLNAALGCAQLEQLPSMLAAKRLLYKKYQKAFADLKGVHLFSEPADSISNYWLQTILLSPELAIQRDSVLLATNQAGYMTRPAWELIHQLAPYTTCPKMDLSQAIELSQRLINIPSSSHLAVAQ
jgi:perosamine synthetase